MDVKRKRNIMKISLADLLKSGIFLQLELPLSKIWAVRSGLKLVQPGVKLDILAYRNWTCSWSWDTELSDTSYIWVTLLDADRNVKVRFVYTIRRVLDGSPSPGTTILFLGSFGVDGAFLEIIDYSIIIICWRNSKAVQRFALFWVQNFICNK